MLYLQRNFFEKGGYKLHTKRITAQDDLNTAFQIRKRIFVEEQMVPLEDEFDEFDHLESPAEHILVYWEGQPVGTGRIRWTEGFGKLERVCILPNYRKLGLGKTIIATLEEMAVEKGTTKVKLHGQTHAEGFYHKLGYQTASDVFIEDGIPHVIMQKKLLD